MRYLPALFAAIGLLIAAFYPLGLISGKAPLAVAIGSLALAVLVSLVTGRERSLNGRDGR
jgi:hypothetical protein